MISSNELYEKVDRLRKEKGLTLHKLSVMAGISHGTMNSWRNRGTMPKYDVIEGICDALNISPISLLYCIDLENLSDDEVDLLVCWRSLADKQKRAFLELLKAVI